MQKQQNYMHAEYSVVHYLGGRGPQTTLQQFASKESWLYGLNIS